MISFIIPTFNRPGSTEKAITSITSQQTIKVEIIVIDDGSEQPFKLDERNQDSATIKLIRKDKNEGPAAARNLGLKLASYPLVSFLDSDDYLLPNTLEERLDFALKQGVLDEAGKIKIIGCSWQETNQSNEIVRIRHPLATTSSDDFYSGCWYCPGSAIIANRDFLKQLEKPYDESLKRLEDLDLFMRLSQLNASYIPHHIIGVSIAVSDSRYPETVIQACEQIREKHLIEPSELSEKCKANLKSYLFYELSRAYISKGEYHRALDNLVKSFIQKPRLKLYPGPGWSSKPIHIS